MFFPQFFRRSRKQRPFLWPLKGAMIFCNQNLTLSAWKLIDCWLRRLVKVFPCVPVNLLAKKLTLSPHSIEPHDDGLNPLAKLPINRLSNLTRWLGLAPMAQNWLNDHHHFHHLWLNHNINHHHQYHHHLLHSRHQFSIIITIMIQFILNVQKDQETKLRDYWKQSYHKK